MSEINISEENKKCPSGPKPCVKLNLILVWVWLWTSLVFHIRLYSLEDKIRAACPWASLSSCVQMRGSVSGQADSSPIPTILVTRHQSVSKQFGPSALWATVAPQQPLILLNTPSTYWTCPFPCVCPNSNPCVLLNPTTLCSTHVYLQQWRWLYMQCFYENVKFWIRHVRQNYTLCCFLECDSSPRSIVNVCC